MRGEKGRGVEMGGRRGRGEMGRKEGEERREGGRGEMGWREERGGEEGEGEIGVRGWEGGGRDYSNCVHSKVDLEVVGKANNQIENVFVQIFGSLFTSQRVQNIEHSSQST